MDIKKTYGFFSLYAKTQTSQAGNKYNSISVVHSKKNQQGQYDKTYFNLIDERDLLVLSSLCQKAYQEITEQKNAERFNKNESQSQVETVENGFDEEIPF